MKILIMSDIHGNEQALKAVLDKVRAEYIIDACFLLGDLIDYGMHSNEVISMIKKLPYPVLCNIRGNHEAAVLSGDTARFSSERGRECSKYTKSILSKESWEYLRNTQENAGLLEFLCCGRRCLAVHGSLENEYWKSIRPEDELLEYRDYDYVFSGHSHHPHFVEKYYPAEDEARRNKKKVIFINPGSVGQPRNHNALAQFVVLDIETERVVFDKAPYDIKKEQASYTGQVDKFYKERLEAGV